MSITRASKIRRLQQSGNTVATASPNLGRGPVALPALAAGATGTVTITDSLIKPTSILNSDVGFGTTTPAANALAAIIPAVTSVAAGSAVVTVRNAGSAATLATDYVLYYSIAGGA